MNPPNGWTGKDYIKAIQLRNNNLPTAALPSNPAEARTCRAGCNKKESLSHVIQQCPVTHWPRINRHNEVAKKIARYCRNSGLEVLEEPHVRHDDGTLYKPDLAIWTSPNTIEIVDVGVNWEGNVPLDQTRIAKKNVYDHRKFREAANKKWPHLSINIEPIILGARGIWSNCNTPIENILQIPPSLKASCVHSVLKWGATIHGEFMRSVWRQRGRWRRYRRS